MGPEPPVQAGAGTRGAAPAGGTTRVADRRHRRVREREAPDSRGGGTDRALLRRVPPRLRGPRSPSTGWRARHHRDGADTPFAEGPAAQESTPA